MMHECMTQEDAMNMSAEQAVQILKPMQMMMLDQHGCPISDVYFAIEKAIAALERERIDAVEVVRCKDCTRWCICRHGDDWFCADAERRSE